jgi:uncharacterized protein (DUF849 family)
MSMNEPGINEVIVNFTPTGMIPTKAMTPHVPISPAEIIDDVLKACDLGITMVHLHARDLKTGVPTYEAEVYAMIIEGIRRHAPSLVLGVSLSGRDFPELEKREAPLALDGDLKPDMGSLTLSSLNFNKQASLNEPAVIQALAKRMLERGIKPELEAFDAGMINYAHYLIRKGLIAPPHYVNLILGNIACAQADPVSAGLMIRDLPEDSLWSIGGIGEFQLPINSMSISIGGGVRVGLEDNIWYDKDRTRLARNADLLERIHLLAAANERPVMSSEELRRRLNLEDGNGRYGIKQAPS